jgi:CubicO group peptidase (beta-lactamase class C family)
MATAMSGGLSEARLARMHRVMTGFVERRELPGVVTLVSRRGETHVDAVGMTAFDGGKPMRRDTIFRVASMTKPVTAVAAMILIEECKLRLDDAVDQWLPELADRKVLKHANAALDDVTPAQRPINLRDLLTFRAGYGFIMDAGPDAPISKALAEAGLAPGPQTPVHAPDEYMRRLGTLPLAHQPGEKWMYHTGSDILGVLIARVSGRPLETFFRERIFEPLGMKDTGFSLPAEKLDRLAQCYQFNATTKTFDFFDDPHNSRWSRPPLFPAGGSGLASTADDYLAFAQMMMNGGRHGRERILSRLSVEAMTTDQLTNAQRAGGGFILGENRGWGLGLAIVVARDDIAAVPGRFGWEGGYGTSWASDPKENLTGILLTQVLWDSPAGPRVYHDFWTSLYSAVDD